MSIANTLIDLLPKTVLTETSFYGWKEGRTWKGFFHDLYQLFCKCNLTNSSTFSLDDVRNGYVSPEFFAEKSIIHLKTSYGEKTEGEWNNIKKELTSVLKIQTVWEGEFQLTSDTHSILYSLANSLNCKELKSKFVTPLETQAISNLTDWAGDYTDRLEAKNRILAFLDSRDQSELDLSSLELTDLPDIFSHPAFSTRLKNLNLSGTNLTFLPRSFDNLQALQTFNLSRTQLTSLPDSFGNLRALQYLDLDKTLLTSLPESFGGLLALQKLSLGRTELTSLPESFGSLLALDFLNLRGTQLTSLPESFGNLIALQRLYLFSTQLTSLPESFGSLSALQELHLFNTPLAFLPESFGNLSALQWLDLSETPLTSLPESFGGLLALQKLYLNETELTSLPSNITSLSHNLFIDISTLPLSEGVQSRLQAATQTPGYNGPRFIYSMAHVERREADLRSTVELMRDLYQELQEPPLTLNEKLEENEDLRTWLSKLSYMADYKAGKENKKALLQNILAYLKLANENSEFQKVFLAIINGAADTCGDRVALSILQIGIAYKIHRADLGRPQDLAHLLLRGVYAMGLLADIARAKVSTLSFVDEIEVYLGYPLKLKEALDLPIDVRNMLYFLCSALTDTDLRNAESFVKEQLNNLDTCHQFLIGHETWLQCLEQNFTIEFNALKDVRDTASDVVVSDADYEKIKKDYEKGLIDLTKQALCPWDHFRHLAR